MIGLLQRVTEASVTVQGKNIASIERGILVLVGVEKEDSETQSERLLERLLGYRVFPDEQGKMNLSLQDISGGLLLVPQFTLVANTQKGTRASFTSAAPAEQGESLFNHLVQHACAHYPKVASGRFGADMQVSLVNDGPVTFWLRTAPANS